MDPDDANWIEREIPQGFSEIWRNVVSNYDGVVDADMEERLKREEIVATYPGWEFHGKVWWDRELQKFCCEVKRYRAVEGTATADTVAELRDVVSRRYGYD